jgi:hypothetical protein
MSAFRRPSLAVLAGCIAVALTATTGVASASTMSLTAKQDGLDEDPPDPNSYALRVTGTADERSNIEIVPLRGAEPCPATADGAGASGRLGESSSNLRAEAGPYTLKSRFYAGLYDAAGSTWRLCAYMTAAADGHLTATATATVEAVEEPPDVGSRVIVGFDAALDLFEFGTTRYGILCEGGQNDECSELAGTVTATVSDAERRRLRLPSTTLLRAPLKKKGGWRIKLSPAVLKALRAKQGPNRRRVVVKAQVTVALTGPFARKATGPVTFSSDRPYNAVDFACWTTSQIFTCTGRQYGNYEYGD